MPPMGPPGPPPGPQLPIGGSMPQGDDFADSPLLAALAGSLGDPYAVPPMGPDQGFQGLGPQDPQGGLQGLLQLLSLAGLGVPGGGPGSSGAPMAPPGMGLGM
jgi:hypothetical protein